MSFNKGFEPKITNKGTELPLLNLKGKPYLQVAHRLVWFREEHPLAEIVTSALQLGESHAVFKAEIRIEGKAVASGHKKETEENFPDFIEKAETGAIGRALAMAGFGTQFEPELDEGDRLADAPVLLPKKENVSAKASKIESKPGNRDSGGIVSGNAPSVSADSKPASSKPSSAGENQPGPAKGEAQIKREELNSLISSTARVVIAKKKETLESIKAHLSSVYKAENKEALTDTQAAELLDWLKGRLND